MMQDQSTPLSTVVAARRLAPDLALTLSRGMMIDGYRLIEPLARGSFGSVWQAEHVEAGMQVAIKFLHPFLCESSEAIARLRREAEAIAAISHPNVVEVFRFDRLADGRPYLVMELLEGDNLFARLREVGPLAPIDALRVLEGICAALTATHALGIIHRDIKASNVLLVEDEDGGERAILLDYGLAKILESDGPELTSSRATLGTPSAMSPEQIRSEPVTAQSDVYALGSLAFHLLTGEPAFLCASRPTILYMHLHSQRPRPSTRVDVSPAFDDVVAKAMARDAKKRYPSPMAFLADFASAVRADGREPAFVVTPARPAPVAKMLGAFFDVYAPPDLFAAPGEPLLDDLEAIAEIAEPILGAAKYKIAARRGSSTLFVAVVAEGKAREERRRLLRLLSVIQSAIDSRPNRVKGVVVRVAVDAIGGDLSEAGAEQALLETTTRVSGLAEATGLVGTLRFFGDLGLATEAADDKSDFVRVVDNAEL